MKGKQPTNPAEDSVTHQAPNENNLTHQHVLKNPSRQYSNMSRDASNGYTLSQNKQIVP